MYFDDFAVNITAGNIIEENHYYAYGLKIATLSSTKLGDGYEGELKNNYLYQGAYSELDDDIGWQDFAFRNYDAQIGRWVQQDPFDEFASPYVGMGDDPVNLPDPSGGFTLGGLTKGGTAAILTLGGAIIGTAVDLISGGDDFTGTLIGAGVGLGAGLSSLITKITANMCVNTVNTAVSVINTSITSSETGSKISIMNVDKSLRNVQYNTSGAQMKTFDVIDSKTNKAIGKIYIPLYKEFEDKEIQAGKKSDGSYNKYIMSGIEIGVVFKNDPKSKYVDFGWIQSATTNQPMACGEGPFNDPCNANHDNKPFYHTKTERESGYDEYTDKNTGVKYESNFYDKPGRQKDPNKKVIWKAELTFVGKKKNSKYIGLITITWGFTIELVNGKWEIKGIEIIKIKPSKFQTDLINEAAKK